MKRKLTALGLAALLAGTIAYSGCKPPPPKSGGGDAGSNSTEADATTVVVEEAVVEEEPEATDPSESPLSTEPSPENSQPTEAAPAESPTTEEAQPTPTSNDTTSNEEGKMSITKGVFGETPDGEKVDVYTCKNASGSVLKLITYGACVQSLEVPDKNGKLADVQLGFPDMKGYLEHPAHFGCTVGRFANRIAKGTFTLDGVTYDKLPINNGENSLHGGPHGFDRVIWKAEPVETADEVGVKFTYTSKDGEAGYPGNLENTVVYTLTKNNELKIDYRAKTDKPTVLNLTNHCYWNLGGSGTGEILDHEVTLNCDKVLELANGGIPTGKILPVEGALDFIKTKPIGKDIDQLKKDPKGTNGYDHCYVVNGTPGELRLAAKVKDPESGRVMEIFTTQPGIQFYTGNFLDGSDANGGHNQHHAFCLETQHYPDAPNQPDFPSTTLRPGGEFHQVTVHKFSVE